MPINRFDQLNQAGHLKEVEMDEADILLPGNQVAIGTRNLNSCSGIVILGKAIILAHIAPLPPHPLGAIPERPIAPDEGEIHFKKILDVVQELYRSHKSQFPIRTTSWAIFGTFEGAIAMPDKLEIAQERFNALGLPMKCAQYKIANATDRTNLAAGTVIGVLQNQKAFLYVEDQVRQSIDFKDPPSIAGATGTATASSATDQPTSVNASSPATGTTANSTTQIPEVWFYSREHSKFFYRTADGDPVPELQWPPRTGRHRVLIVETRTQKGFDFDVNKWFDL